MSLRGGDVRQVQGSEWETGKPIAPHFEAIFREQPTIKGTEVYCAGRVFKAQGDHLYDETPFALSPDGTWLAVMSYNGTAQVRSGFQVFGPSPRGRFYIDVSCVSSGKAEAAVIGAFVRDDPFSPADHAVWLSDRHLLIPQNSSNAILCDLSSVSPSGEAPWDILEPEGQVCVVTLDRSSSTATLLADKPSAPGRALRINSHDTAQNSQCDVSDLTLSIESPDSLRFTMTARFARKFAGVRNIFARVEDKSGQRSAWRWLGIWLVPDE